MGDLSYSRFSREVVEIDVESGDFDRRVLASLTRVRDSLGDSSPEVTRFLRLGQAFDQVRSALETADPSDIVKAVAGKSAALSSLIENMQVADEAVADGLGVQALELLHSKPQRTIGFGDSVVMLGVFAPRGLPDRAHALMVKWRVARSGSNTEVVFDSFDEPLNGLLGIENMLVEVAYESGTEPVLPRTRAAVLASLETFSSVGDINDLRRRFAAIGAVHDTVVETVVVPNVRSLADQDRVLAERGYRVLFVLAQAHEHWAFSRATDFGRRGGDAHLIDPASQSEVLEQIADRLRDMFNRGPDGDGDERRSSLSPEQLTAARSTSEANRIKVVCVGGDETQERYRTAIERHLAAVFGAGITVLWFSGWASSWNTIANAIDRELPDADAVVLLPLVRTELGSTVRRRAGECGVPWIPCNGKGKSSIQTSIEEAILVVVRRRGGSV